MWSSSPENRLKLWKGFRADLSRLSLSDALQATNNLWSSAPFIPYYLDYQTPETWPDPWELLYKGRYCDLAKGLGILYTLYLSDHRLNLSFELRVYKDQSDKNEYNLVWLNNGEYILNSWLPEVINTQQYVLHKDLELLKRVEVSALKIN